MLEHLPFVCLQETLNSPSSQQQGSSPGLLCLLPSLEREADSQESQSHVGKTTQTGDIALPAQPQPPPVPVLLCQHSSHAPGCPHLGPAGQPGGCIICRITGQ